MHGHFIQAVRYNVFLVAVAPYIIALLVEHFLLSGEIQRRAAAILESKQAVCTYLVLYFVWFVVRNILKV